MGAVNVVVGTEGCSYISPDGKEYKLTGWTLGAIAAQEQYLEQRSFEMLSRLRISPEDRAAAYAVLAKEMGASFSCSYGTKTWDNSLSAPAGIANFFHALSGCKLSEANQLMQEDGEGVQEAVFKANPHYRATAETPKAEDQATA